jgi:hypothetical protein
MRVAIATLSESMERGAEEYDLLKKEPHAGLRPRRPWEDVKEHARPLLS